MTKCEEMLRNAVQNGGLMEVYSDRDDTEKFAVVRVLAVDDEYAVMQSVTPYGVYDGLWLKALDEIYRVSEKSKYLEAMKLICTKEDSGFEAADGIDLKVQLLRFAMERNLPVSIELLDSGRWDIQGFVKSVEDGVLMSALTVYGEYDGENAFDIGDVVEIACDGEDERKLARLAEIKNE